MSRVLVTGMSGTGKSSLLAELARRGRRVVDTDEPGWKLSNALWDESRIAALLDRHDDLFVAGAVENQGRFYDRFDAVVLLSAPERVLLERIASRTSNDFGKSDAERAAILRDLREVEPLLRATCTHEIDATLPLGEIAAVLEGL